MTLLLDSLAAIGTLLIAVLGLAVVLGVLNVINLAHTGFMAVGVYAAVGAHQLGWTFAAAVLAGVLASAVAGLIVEIVIIRRLYDRPLETILATWGVSLVIVQCLTLGYGHNNQALGHPVQGGTEVLGTPYPTYRLLLVGIAAVLVLGLAVVLRFSSAGLTVRMVQANENFARAMGMRVSLIRASTFVVGCALAGLAGGLLGPTQTITPNYGASLVATAFLAVLLAGGRLPGLIGACVILGAAQTLFAHWANPMYSSIVQIGIAVVLLRIRPEGLTWRRLA